MNADFSDQYTDLFYIFSWILWRQLSYVSFILSEAKQKLGF